MREVAIKTHLIITDTHDEYHMSWQGKIINTKPKFKDDKLMFAIVGGKGRMEINTLDMQEVERCAKLMTLPRGRDAARVYLIEEDDKETLMGIMTHNHVKKYAPMYDKVGYSD
jgi:hypothetical protein